VAHLSLTAAAALLSLLAAAAHLSLSAAAALLWAHSAAVAPLSAPPAAGLRGHSRPTAGVSSPTMVAEVWLAAFRVSSAALRFRAHSQAALEAGWP